MTDDPRIDPADLRNVRFPGSSRRYDARSVDQFLETVASRIAATNLLVDDLRAQLAEAASSAVAAPAPTPSDLSLLDDDQLVRLVGEETATVLSTARRAAEEIRSKAEESAARVIREATAEADRLGEEARATAAELTAGAEEAHARATEEAEEAAARIRREAEADAERTRADADAAAEAQQAELDARRGEAEAEAERILAEAREEGRAMVAEAKEVRSRILDDLQRRRDAAREQIERLLVGRERLLDAYGRVRENLDEITAELADALPEPAEPDLPDGFVGIVGGTTADEDAADDEPDDTVAPAPAPEADVAADGDGADPEDAAAAADGHDDDAGPEDALGPVPADLVDDAAAPTRDDTDETDETEDADGSEAERPEAPEDAAAEDAAPAALAEEDPPVEELDPAPVDPEEPVEAAAEEAAAPGDVDALFARLRAEREESVARAQEVLGEADDDEDDQAGSEPATLDAGSDEVPGAEDVPAVTAGDVDRVPPEFLASEADLDRRTGALRPLEEKLNRALKRRLADEQNELLDLLRRSSSTDPATLLPSLDDQVAGYAVIAERLLADAATAGGSSADVAHLSEALARTLVEPFHRRVERAAAEVDGDPDELDERLRALYREWKAQHVGPAAADALLSAYAVGTLERAGDAGTVRWLIDPGQGPCPDAQDNALAGTVDAGQAFPTGDRCPQAHPGCRCLLVIE